ncbi:MAG: DUF4097 family beta strand repeat-containing protein [Acidobacteriota bacterium]
MKRQAKKIKALLIATALAAALSGLSRAQDPTPDPNTPQSIPESVTKPVRPKINNPHTKVNAPRTDREVPIPPSFPAELSRMGGTFERSIAVDPKVTVSLCVTQGDVKVNGWSRNEVRVFVKDGSKVGFDVVQSNRQGNKPVWIKVVGSDPNRPAGSKECLWGGAVELDVPEQASVDLEGTETRSVVDSIRKIKIKNAGGNISVRNVTEGVSATTYEGNVDVENSDGTMTLESSTGNIVVFESGPSQVGDTFRAKTNGGTISLQHIEHRQLDVSSISGSILMNSELLTASIYNISTSNGSIIFGVPNIPPCFFSATYGFGRFDSEVPIKIITENNTPGPIKTVRGTFENALKTDCKLTLTTSSGTIRIRKRVNP